jgi:hypothetical protein
MTRESVPEDIQRFILTSVTSVPYLEAMLLVRRDENELWDAQRVAQRLYLNEKIASDLLAQLCAAGVLNAQEPQSSHYRYAPSSEKLRQMIDRLSEVYAKHLVQIANLIHLTTDKRAQQFADAFKLRKDP